MLIDSRGDDHVAGGGSEGSRCDGDVGVCGGANGHKEGLVMIVVVETVTTTVGDDGGDIGGGGGVRH